MHADAGLFLLDSIFQTSPTFCTLHNQAAPAQTCGRPCAIPWPSVRVLSCTLALLPVPHVLPSTCDGRRARRKSRTGRRQGRPCTRTRVWKAAWSIAPDRTAPCALWFRPLRLLRAVSRCRRPLLSLGALPGIPLCGIIGPPWPQKGRK